MSTAAWAQMHGEPDEAYQAFVLWLSFPAPRPSVDRISAIYNVQLWTIRGWQSAYAWHRRATLHDDHFLQLRRREREAIENQTREDVKYREQEIVALARELAATELGKLVAQAKRSQYTVAKPSEIARFMRLSLALAESSSEAEDEPKEGADVEALSDEDLSSLDQIVKKAKGRTDQDIK